MTKYIKGKIVHGEGWARRLGYSTANMRKPSTRKMPLKHGVYAAWGRIGKEKKWRKAILIVGAPAFFQKKVKKLEIYFINFKGNLYGKQVTAKPVHFVRPMRKFTNTRERIAQIKKDLKAVKGVLLDE
ncbi:MAG: riboflavin kinase [Patescibacteria group bacterium]|jgi:riboflavin kinase/FMN adenylyltransferase